MVTFTKAIANKLFQPFFLYDSISKMMLWDLSNFQAGFLNNTEIARESLVLFSERNSVEVLVLHTSNHFVQRPRPKYCKYKHI